MNVFPLTEKTPDNSPFHNLRLEAIVTECALCDSPKRILSDHPDGVFICRDCREELSADHPHGEKNG